MRRQKCTTASPIGWPFACGPSCRHVVRCRVDDLVRAHPERVQRLLDPTDEVTSSPFGRGQDPGGEDRGVGGGEDEGSAPQRPGPQQRRVLVECGRQSFGGDAVDPRVEGQRRGPRRAVLDAALPGRIGQPPCIHLLGEVVGGEPEADDRVRRHRGGHAATVRRHPVVVGTETTKIWLTR